MSDRNYYVRIGIVLEVNRLALMSSSVAEVSNPANLSLGRLNPGEVYTVEIIRGRVGGNLYRLVIRELDPGEGNNAVVLARAAAQAYGLPAKAVRMPADGEEPERLIVTVGEFNSLAEARAYREKRKSDTVRFIFEEKTLAREGRVILRDSSGALVASDASRLTLLPVSQKDNKFHLQALEGSARAPGRGEMLKARNYRGQVELAINEKGTLTAINDLWIEYYLYGVVAAEIGSDAPLEAMKAQAVAARSTTVAWIENGTVSQNPLYDFVDSTTYQSYQGVGKETDPVRLAVNSTRGEVLVWQGKPVEAFYSHSCGGVINSVGDVWNTKDAPYFARRADRLQNNRIPDLSASAAVSRYLDDTLDAFCNTDPAGAPDPSKSSFRWKATLDNEALTRKFDKGYGTGRIRDIVIERRSSSGRVRVIRVVGDQKTVRIDREMTIRTALGGLKSTFLVFDPKYDPERRLQNLDIRGGGYGHGVGLCQMGAIAMANRNYNYRQILGHYFVDVKIRRLYG